MELSESGDLSSPAVVGWRRPVILLPAERTRWTRDHLRAALST